VRSTEVARLAHTRADAVQVQGPRTVQTALMPREVIAKQDPPSAAHQREPHARLGISALVELRTSKLARSLQEASVLLQLCQLKTLCAWQGSGAQEVQTTRQPVLEARMLLRKDQHLWQRVPTAL
jgi:hypothetical protein